MRDAESAVVTLGKLRSLGVHLAVDDFGTGYSSLTYLKRFPVEALKVDRTFVDGLGRGVGRHRDLHRGREPRPRARARARSPRASRPPAQVAELRQLGCELAQGYLFGRPEPSETFGERPDAKQWGPRVKRELDPRRTFRSGCGDPRA